MTLATLMQRMMLGGQAAAPPALNFNGSDIYGDLTHPSISPGDFEHIITFKTTGTGCSILGTTAAHTANRLQPFINGSGVLIMYHAGQPIVQTLAAVNDDLEHTAVVGRTGSAWSLTLDTVPQDTGTGTGTVTIDRAGNNDGSQWFAGQLPSFSLDGDLYLLNNGSTTAIPVFGGGAEEITLHGVDAGDWS